MIASNPENFLNWFPEKNFNWIYNWLGSGWKTETRYPCDRPRLNLKWCDPEIVVGIRFESLTRYAMIDIDSGSPFHPNNNLIPLEQISKIEASLESIGINRIVWIQSSSSGGLHGYIAFPELAKTYKTAQLINQTLQASGFTIKQGVLEIFPNCKAYSKTSITQYNGHRLPLQPGTDSFLLTRSFSGTFEQISSDINRWNFEMLEAAKCQDFELFKTKLDKLKINRSIITHQYSSDAAKWRQDLENLVQKGWTASGQTNEILFFLLQLGVVFHNLQDEKLTEWMVKTAQSMSGFKEFCSHQNNIQQRCQDWVNWNEKHKRYLPYADHPSRSVPINSPYNQNQTKSLQAREKIAKVVSELTGQLFNSCRQLLQAIIDKSKQLFTIGISLKTLYKYQHLWNCLLTINDDSKTVLQEQTIVLQTVLQEPIELSMKLSGCVTVAPSSFQATPQKSEIPETPSQQAVTHLSLNEGFCSEASRILSSPVFPSKGVQGEMSNEQPLESPLSSIETASGTNPYQDNFDPLTDLNNEALTPPDKKQRLLSQLESLKQRLPGIFNRRDKAMQKAVEAVSGIDLPPPILPSSGGG